MSTYKDPRVECTETQLRLRWYYLWGSKRIPYPKIRSFDRFHVSVLRSKWRIWGSGDLRHWANFDPQRPQKQVGFYLHVGRWVIPVVTPDNPDAFEAVLAEHVSPSPDR
ncbi:MAG TPA: hypothetical protein VNG12_24535 [Acidimicrobiales bacterium]|nr:hypothetical protein [Acidimicrobiales bacterium]